MKYSMSPSRYRYVIGRDSVLTFSSFSPARKVFSTTAPLSMLRKRVLTNAPPLPGLTCWKYKIVNRLPSTRMAVPFLNWLVDIMPEVPLEDAFFRWCGAASGSGRPPRDGLLRGGPGAAILSHKSGGGYAPPRPPSRYPT